VSCSLLFPSSRSTSAFKFFPVDLFDENEFSLPFSCDVWYDFVSKCLFGDFLFSRAFFVVRALRDPFGKANYPFISKKASNSTRGKIAWFFIGPRTRAENRFLCIGRGLNTAHARVSQFAPSQGVVSAFFVRSRRDRGEIEVV